MHYVVVQRFDDVYPVDRDQIVTGFEPNFVSRAASYDAAEFARELAGDGETETVSTPTNVDGFQAAARPLFSATT
jgi:hypothetical protein